MREHPIPQDITGYKFHIIGNMTLKQFAELAAGALLGVILYSTNLPVFLKWPLIFISISTGAAAAFLPFEERPLDHWIITFVRIMYRPTKFFWRREEHIPDAFSFSASAQSSAPTDVDLTPARRDRIKEYLASVPTNDQPLDAIDQQEALRMQEIMNAFKTVTTTTVSATQQAQKPTLNVRVRSLKTTSQYELSTGMVTVFDQKKRDPLLTKQQKSVEEVALNIAIPELSASEVEKQQATTTNPATDAQQNSAYLAASDTASDGVSVDGEIATFNASLPFPNKPTEPNKLVGMLLTPNNELIPEAIVEVRDEQNRVVRAVKTNALGQFFVTTPLGSGNYTIVAEHDRYQFPSVSITLQDEAVDPLEIRSLG